MQGKRGKNSKGPKTRIQNAILSRRNGEKKPHLAEQLRKRTKYQITHLSVIEDRPERLKPCNNPLETHPVLTKIFSELRGMPFQFRQNLIEILS